MWSIANQKTPMMHCGVQAQYLPATVNTIFSCSFLSFSQVSMQTLEPSVSIDNWLLATPTDPLCFTLCNVDVDLHSHKATAT